MKKRLTKKEEEIMQVLWSMKKAFTKDLLNNMPKPQPHYNTLSTMLKILKEKGFVDIEKYGNVFQYYPLVSKEEYQSEAVGDILEKYFDNSYSNLITHFAKKEKISEDELKDILRIIQSKKS